MDPTSKAKANLNNRIDVLHNSINAHANQIRQLSDEINEMHSEIMLLKHALGEAHTVIIPPIQLIELIGGD